MAQKEINGVACTKEEDKIREEEGEQITAQPTCNLAHTLQETALWNLPHCERPKGHLVTHRLKEDNIC